MQNLINKFSGLVVEAGQLVADYKKRHSDLDQREKKLVSDKAGVDALLAEISKRESAITPLENLSKAKVDVEAKLAALTSQREAFETQKAEFEKLSAVTRQELKNLADEVSEAQKNVEIGKKKIAEEVQKQVDEFIAKFKNS
jgi:chromosome segregation ATPase